MRDILNMLHGAIITIAVSHIYQKTIHRKRKPKLSNQEVHIGLGKIEAFLDISDSLAHTFQSRKIMEEKVSTIEKIYPLYDHQVKKGYIFDKPEIETLEDVHKNWHSYYFELGGDDIEQRRYVLMHLMSDEVINMSDRQLFKWFEKIIRHANHPHYPLMKPSEK